MQKRLLIRISVFIAIIIALSTVCKCSEPSNLDKAMSQAEEIKDFLSFDKLINLFTGNILTFFKTVSANLSLSVCVLLIAAVMSSFKDSFSKYQGIFDIITDCALILSILPIVIICCQSVESSILSICGYMTAFIPVGCALLASSGNPVSSATSSLYSSFMINTVQLISVSLILPCIKAIFSVASVNVLCRQSNLSGVTAFFKSLCLWIIGLSFTILTGVYSLQTILSASADNLALKGLRFSAARLIPVAGGMISESMRTVISGMEYIKSVSGIGAVVFTIYILTMPFCSVICTKLLLALLSALAKAVNLENPSKLFDSFSAHINILSALLAGCGISFIIVLAMFIKISVNI